MTIKNRLASDALSSLVGHKYINVETYRKNGKAVSTPVWFTVDESKIFVVTRTNTGKVKRLKNNKELRFMPCGSRGQPKGEWISGTATFCTPEQLQRALKDRNKKYGLQAKLTGILSRSKGDLIAFAITPK